MLNIYYILYTIQYFKYTDYVDNNFDIGNQI